jgi:hypothetical protein
MSSKVRSALIKSFIDLSTAEGWQYDIVTENSPAKPDLTKTWIGVTYLPNVPDVVTLGNGGEDELTGIFQLDIFMPLGKGEKEALDISDKLRTYFTAGRRFVYMGQEVVIRNCGRSQGFIANNQFRIPISVIWYSRLTRTIN